MNEPHDWDRVLELYARLERSEALEMTADVLALCRRVARDVAISDDDAERALLKPGETETLVREMRRRIFEGSRRLSRAFARSDRLKKAGDVAGARAVLEEVLAVEVVPLYRQHATTMLDDVDDPED
jgi:DUSAM domain-containing protein